ncbi:MAG TPA: YbgC/FadM family acyl-CoA thioesterase [Candidatus Omnitrophota bacterium]|nr:YbgC/FadM family acyl-CoA thioesterase [Candidatus Omnitrophota bacterium]HPD85283.1 YbgC/FadM family acyl-CoA thioesterase [Candidatus Omnitrophota bacterium]HRZ04216.1 YbgC/FadM family acyl-CoA thioesterase [Candidatus Omnitrophota bacterium]
MEKRIFFHDTDAGGIVYYGNYLKYMEEARTEFLENKGMSVAEFHRRGLLYAVSQCSIRYRSPAKYGEILICDALLKEVTAVKLIFEQKISEKESNRLIAEAEIILVCLNKDFRPTSIPEDLKAKILAS